MNHYSKKSFRVGELSWPQVEKAISNKDVVAILPIAAESKEHGFHLPMDTDFQQAQWIIGQLLTESGLLIWPCINYGYYPAFVEFTGSVTTMESTFIHLVEDVIESIFLAGISKLVLLNTGISTIKPLTQVIDQSKHTLYLVNVYSGEKFKQVESQIIQQSAGGHADETETSIMLAINQNLVDMTQAIGSNHACSVPGVLRRFDQNSPNYTSSGACGCPQYASVEKGKKLLKAMMLDVKRQLANIKDT